MQIRIEAYAVARERLGFAAQLLELEDATPRVGDLVALLSQRHPQAAQVLAASRYALNGEYVHLGTPVRDQDTVSVLPPVSGGAPDPPPIPAARPAPVRVGPESIAVDETMAAAGNTASGAIVLFVGTVRDHNDGATVTAIEYEAKADMAVRELERLIGAATSKHALTGAAIRHRTGRVAAGEISVVIATAAPHRDAAYAANRELLEELKRIAPIWKHEERLVDGRFEKTWLGAGGG